MDLGQFSFEPESGELRSNDGRPIALKRQTRTLLRVLASAEGCVVSKDQLMSAVWPDVTVSEDSLYQAVAEVRRVLGADGHTIVQSVPREGYRLVARSSASRHRGRWRVVAGVLLAAALIGGAVLSSRTDTPAATRHPVIAVLPFDTLAGDESWRRLGRGLSAEIAAELAQSAWLDVIAPEVSETLAGVAPLHAAETLSARFLLDGSIAADGDTLRVSTRLTDAGTQKVIWSERWTGEPEEFLDLESEILERMTGALGGALTGVVSRTELEHSKSRQPGSLDAYDHFLLGLEAKHHWNAEGFELAATHFRKAIELDPDYAKAWSFLSLSLSFLALESVSQEERVRLWSEANSAAEQAFALDPNDPEVLWRVARERAAHGDMESAQQSLRRSVALAPSNADVLMVAAWTSHYAGVRGDDPLIWARRAHELTPIRPAKYTISLGLAAFSARNYELSAQTLRNAPPSVEVLAHLASAEALLGNVSAARDVSRRLREIRPEFVMDDLFGPSGLQGFPDLDDLRRGAALAGLPISRSGPI